MKWAVLFVFGSLTLAIAANGTGKETFVKRCGGCHDLERDKAGPRLRGVFGRKAATGGSFEYSDALRKSGVVWDAATLDKWIADPDSVAPGTDMAFRSNNASERAAIIEYLKTQ